MTEQPADPRNEHDLARRNRLAKALRDNLKRRKSQSRGRADAPAGPAQAERSRQHDTDGEP